MFLFELNSEPILSFELIMQLAGLKEQTSNFSTGSGLRVMTTAIAAGPDPPHDRHPVLAPAHSTPLASPREMKSAATRAAHERPYGSHSGAKVDFQMKITGIGHLLLIGPLR